MTSVTSTILELKNLHKVFNHDLFQKKTIAVNDVSCDFLTGKCTGLLGHNGAGKTTAIKMILGLIKPTKGKVIFDGKPLTITRKSKIGYMPEVNRLPANLSCEEVLEFHLRIYTKLGHKQRRDLIQSSLEQVSLDKVKRKKIKELSKGMARRLAWAQATIHSPTLVILDEPFSGLDPVARHDLLNWIKAYKAAGNTLILCTHELWTVRELCDEVHIFKNGQLAYTTTDRAVDQHGIRLNAANYHLAIAGVDDESLKNLLEHQKLKPWSDMQYKDFLVQLHFNEYEVAVAWLKACVEQGFIIVRFSDEVSIDHNTIYKLFVGDS